MLKWLLSYDPEVESHPWTLVQVDTTDLTGKLKRAVQCTTQESAINYLQNSEQIERDTVTL